MITVEQMLLRKRLLEQNAKRHRRRKIPIPKPPMSIVLKYTAILIALSREMDRAIYDALAEAHIVRIDADMPVLPSQVQRAIEWMRKKLVPMTSRQSLVGQIDAIADDVGEYTRELWQRQLQAAYGIDYIADLNMGLFVRGFREENLDLISTLAQSKIDRVRDVLVEGGPGMRVEELAEQIQYQTGVTESHAALLARDQTLKLNGQMARARHEAAGIQQYRWITSNDQRVRESHKVLNDHVFVYGNPPVVDEKTGRRCEPGQDYQCRCVSEPLLPGIDDVIGAPESAEMLAF